MKRRWLIPLLLLSLGLNLGLLIIRFSSPLPPPPPPDISDVLRQHLSHMTDDLGLMEEQRSKLKSVYDRVFPLILETSSRVRDLRQEVTANYASPQIKPEELKGHLERLNAAHAALDSLLAETILSEASILSNEQRRCYLEEMPWSRSGEGGNRRPEGNPPPRGEEPPPPSPRSKS